MSPESRELAIQKAYNACVTESVSAEDFIRDQGDDITYCPRIFDGWGCWNATPRGHIAYISCPAYVTGFDPQRFAHKICNEDGSWFRHPDTNLSWSNYTTCVDTDDLAEEYNNQDQPYRSLKCIRIRIHRNLFLSFVMNNSSYVIWHTVMGSPEVVAANPLGCQVLHVILQYFLVCNYFWMFCEGLYLHTILVVAFVDKESIMKWLYLIGWGIPLPLTVAYAATRGSFPTETEHCWINGSPYYWILMAPVCASMFANLIFLICIVKVLVTKLRAVKSSDTDQTKKAVRATIILIPLLGLQYLVTPFRPKPGTSGEFIYDIISAVVTSFQGLCVSLLFCFCNTEIIYLVQSIWSHQRSIGCRRNASVVLSSATTVNQSRAESNRWSSQRKSPSRKPHRERNHICLEDIAPTHQKRSISHIWRGYTNNNKHKSISETDSKESFGKNSPLINIQSKEQKNCEVQFV